MFDFNVRTGSISSFNVSLVIQCVQRSWIKPDRWASDRSSELRWVDRSVVTLGDFPLPSCLNTDQSSSLEARTQFSRGKSKTEGPFSDLRDLP